MKKIYLAGPMLNCTDAQATFWRAQVKKALEGMYEFMDPVEFESAKDTKDDWKKLVEEDLYAIKKCDIVLAYCWKASPGTSMEMVYAFTTLGKTVVSVNVIQSPWVHYHSHFCFDKVEYAIAFLKGSI